MAMGESGAVGAERSGWRVRVAVVTLVAILGGGAPMAAFAAGPTDTAAAEAAKPEKASTPRRLSNSPDNIKKRECDTKWKAHKKEAKPTGWKPYFTFMANCM
jgi:hypothetical protein